MTKPRVRKLAFLFVSSVCALLVAAIIAVNLYQLFKRHQAEKLLAEIANLELRRATYEDAQRIAKEWRRYATEKPGCDRERCDIEITLIDFNAYPRALLSEPWLARLMLRTGLRPAAVRARVGLLNGVVWSKSYGFDVYVRDLDRAGAWPFVLMGEVSSAPRLGYVFNEPQLRLHPDYVIGKPDGCEGPCVSAYAHFTPYANPADVRRLLRINLGCLTRWRPCQTQADILPAAWAQWEREESAKAHESFEHSCSRLDRVLLGRDSAFAAIVQITSVQRDPDSGDKVRARMIRLLKPTKPWAEGTEVQFSMDDRALADPEFKPQKRSMMIALLDEWPAERPRLPVWVRPCELYPLTVANLQAILKGIEQDYGAQER